MALIKCPECGKEISNLSDVCIHCGFPVKKYIEPVKQPVEPVQQSTEGIFSGSVRKANNTYENRRAVPKTETMLTGSDVQRISERMKENVEQQAESKPEWWKLVITYFCGFCPTLMPVGIILAWVWRIPRRRDKRILLTIILVLYPFVLYMQFL